MSSRFRSERSRSPDHGIKLHVSNLPIEFPQGQLVTLFSKYGTVGKVRVIRNGPKGFPLRQHCYAFVVMDDALGAQKAVEDLNTRGWEVTLSKDSKVALSCPNDIFWSGFLTRCNSLKVSVNAKIVKGLKQEFLRGLFQIDISHRARVSELPNYLPKLVITLEASNSSEKDAFMEHIYYFQMKDRVGVARIAGETVFIIPPGKTAEGIYEKMRLDQMLGSVWGDKEELRLPKLRTLLDADLFKPDNTLIAPAP